MQANSDVMVLVSVGQHPLSGRSRRAERDAKALEIALAMGASPCVALAGDPKSPAVREYLGMGLPRIDVLKQPQDADFSIALCEYVRSEQPSLVLCGARAEHGESSGMVPYLVAKALRAVVVPEVVAVLSRTDDSAEVLQALAGGQRRKLRVRLPTVLIASGSAPDARQSAFTKARDGAINELGVPVLEDIQQQSWQWQTAKPRPKRTKTVSATASSRDRFRAATAAQESAGGEVLKDVSPEDAALAILKLVREKGVL